ncbi:pyridoxamine phosphate oxidase family protein [Delphinella strobiligena]|nr:pyridoxamine phosphate oxidase family protein [Delphinella strobiligena]
MPAFFDSLSDSLRDWALKQQVFFIASAPRFGKHVNVSPKGLPASTFTVLDPNTACYIDATGSGAETIAHLYETNRCTVMFCSFEKNPRIMRFFCTGTVIEFTEPEYESLLERMGKEHVDGARAVILLHIFKVQTSCGYGVPLLKELEAHEANEDGPRAILEDRKTLGHWASKKVEEGGMAEYRAKNNARSLDDMAGLKAARRTNGEVIWLEDLKIYLRRLSQQWDVLLIGMMLAFFILMVGGGLPMLKERLTPLVGLW